MYNIHYNFNNILTSIIQLNKDLRNQLINEQYILTTPQYIREFGVIHLNLGRRVGYTSYIIHHMQPNDLVVLKTNTLKDNFIHMCQSNNITFNPRNIITTHDLKDPIRWRGRKDFNDDMNIWIDNYSLCHPDTLHNTISICNSNHQTIICLQ
jgi:hypothetical protein